MDNERLNKRELMQKIMEYKFAINDLALFLDTHPCDRKALKKQQEYVEQYEKYKNQYIKFYGPLSIYDRTDSWDSWVFEPWPWERSY